MESKKADTKATVSPTIAKSDDGNLQITFTIPWSDIKKKRVDALNQLGKDVEVPGFRKGKAPIEKVAEHIPQSKLIERTLSEILPKLVGDVITKNKLRIALYPRFELISSEENKDWQVRALTCEIPDFEVGNYKDQIKSTLIATQIWTPDNAGNEQKKERSQAEKQDMIIEFLLKTIPAKIPKILIDEEANARLANLLDRIEKLGLSLDNYLASVGKTPESIRSEYEKQAKDAITIELILNKISDEENIKVEENEISAAINAGSASKELGERLNTAEHRNLIQAILKRRKALDYLSSLL